MWEEPGLIRDYRSGIEFRCEAFALTCSRTLLGSHVAALFVCVEM